MTATWEYPGSRIKGPQCLMCRVSPGYMVDSGRIKLEDTKGVPIELMKWTCNKCGYTVFLDLEVPKRTRWEGDDFVEILPE